MLTVEQNERLTRVGPGDLPLVKPQVEAVLVD